MKKEENIKQKRGEYTHTSDFPLPANPSPTDPYTGTSKESPSILNSPPTYTNSTVPTPSIPLILQERADVTCTRPRHPPPPSFLHANFVAIREDKFGFLGESNQGFRGGSLTS